jgi:hypothetical protein
MFHNILVTLWSLAAWIPPSTLLYCPENICHQPPSRMTSVYNFWNVGPSASHKSRFQRNRTEDRKLCKRPTADVFLHSPQILQFFSLFGEHLCIHCFDYPLVSTFTNETQVSSPVSHKMLYIHRHLSGVTLRKQTAKRKPFSAFCARVSMSRTYLTQNLTA